MLKDVVEKKIQKKTSKKKLKSIQIHSTNSPCTIWDHDKKNIFLKGTEVK